MCQFVSWVETENGKCLFLTKKDLSTKRGKELKKYLIYPSPLYFEDIVGHGAIRYFFDIPNNKGTDREITDFSSPNNFPKVIVKAIKKGDFEGIGFSLQLLNSTGKEEYEKIEQPAYTEYEKIRQSAWAEYKKIEQPDYTEYKKIKRSAYTEYEKIKQPAFWKIFKLKKYRNKEWR